MQVGLVEYQEPESFSQSADVIMALIGSLHCKLLCVSLKLIFDFGWEVRDDPFLESYSGSFNKMKVGAKTKSTLDIM